MTPEKRDYVLAVGMAIFFSLAGSGWGAQFISRGAQASTNEINITADKLSTGDGSNQIEATGNVEIKREGMTLKADEVRVNRETQDMEAKGKVTVDDPDWKVKAASSLQLNLEKETGEIQDGDLFLEEGHISLGGRRFQKLGGQTYHVDDGFFTTCLCESGAPSWKVSADQMDLSLEGLGTVKNGYFYIFDVPVLYIPYGVFPLRTERQTGFLFPKLGQSTKDGFRFMQPFFWAISKSTDSTVKVDIESRTRFGFLGEFRTMFDRDSDFKIESSYFNEIWRKNADASVVDKTIASPTIPQDRWSLIGTHRYATGADWLTFSDFAVYRDDLFTRELVDRFDLPGSQELNIQRSRFGESRFGVFRNWGDTFLKGQWNFYQDFIQPDSTTLQRTPQVGFWGRRFLGDFPLEFRWRTEGVNYWRPGGVNHANPQTGDGLRFDLRPEAVLPFRLASNFFGSLSVAPRETLYHLYTPPVQSSDRNVSRELVELRGNVNTALSRVFAFDALGLSHVKHVIEPEISYLFVPGVNQSKIPIMDEIDRINRRNVLTFAVTNRFWGKLVSGLTPPSADSNVEMLSSGVIGDVRQMASLRTALSFDINKARKGGDSLSDIDFNFRLSPTPYIDIGLDGGINPGRWDITQTRVGLAITDPRPMLRRTLDADFNRPNSFTMGFQFLRRGPNSFLADDANIDLDAPANCVAHPLDPRCPGTGFDKNTVGNLSNSLLYHLTDNLLFNFSSTYDALDNRFIGFRAITKVLSFCECWTATFSVKHDVNPAKTSFSFDFGLLGLGNSNSSAKR
jgi:LPS-assembly protein